MAALAGGLALAAVLASGASPARLASSQPMAYSDLNWNVYMGTAANGNPATIYQSDGTTTLASLAITPDGSSVLVLSTGECKQHRPHQSCEEKFGGRSFSPLNPHKRLFIVL